MTLDDLIKEVLLRYPDMRIRIEVHSRNESEKCFRLTATKLERSIVLIGDSADEMFQGMLRLTLPLR